MAKDLQTGSLQGSESKPSGKFRTAFNISTKEAEVFNENGVKIHHFRPVEIFNNRQLYVDEMDTATPKFKWYKEPAGDWIPIVRIKVQ